MNKPYHPEIANALEHSISFRLNGREQTVIAEPAARSANVLRDKLGLTGTKIGCNAGDCGACTVLLDGDQVCACLTALGQVEGRTVTTVEGLAENGVMSRLQQAFHRHGGAQCGICTPGMLMADGFVEQKFASLGAGNFGRARRRVVPLHRLSKNY